jgi:hypothetical protein
MGLLSLRRAISIGSPSGRDSARMDDWRKRASIARRQAVEAEFSGHGGKLSCFVARNQLVFRFGDRRKPFVRGMDGSILQ